MKIFQIYFVVVHVYKNKNESGVLGKTSLVLAEQRKRKEGLECQSVFLIKEPPPPDSSGLVELGGWGGGPWKVSIRMIFFPYREVATLI